MDTENQIYQYDEEKLIRLASKADLDAFNQLVLHYQNLAYNQAYSLMGDPAQADDATQESFIKAFQNLSSFRGGSFRAWLLRIVTNTCYDMLRRLQRYPTQSLTPEDEYGDEVESPSWLADPAASVQEIVEVNDEMACLSRLLDELPEVYRNTITLIDLHEFDYGEAATSLGVPVGTIKSRLARARIQLKEKLEVECFHYTPAQTNRMGVAA